MISLTAVSVGAWAQPTTRPRPKVVTNDPNGYQFAYQHGYRAGYEDGFTKGKSDFSESQPRDFARSDAYQRADRTYSTNMGTRAEYQESYRIGFEMGYNDSYYGRPFTVSMPTNLGKAVIAAVNESAPAYNGPPPSDPPRQRASDNRDQEPRGERRRNRDRDTVSIPDDLQMKLRLQTPISTKTNKEGDTFTAVVLDPSDYAEAVVEGHIAKLNKSGKVSGKTEMSLAFDSIQLRDGRSGRLAGQVEKVYESQTVKTVDEEGNVQSGSQTKDTAVRSVGGGALGAIIGGIASGGKGAAIGAILGAGVGAGSVAIQGGKDLVLEPGTEMLIRTAAPAREQD
jgi:outer membrane lipoprotein SlyB